MSDLKVTLAIDVVVVVVVEVCFMLPQRVAMSD